MTHLQTGCIPLTIIHLLELINATVQHVALAMFLHCRYIANAVYPVPFVPTRTTHLHTNKKSKGHWVGIQKGLPIRASHNCQERTEIKDLTVLTYTRVYQHLNL